MLHLEPMRRKRFATVCGFMPIVFLTAQVFGVAHATAHGDQNHHHDEVPCAVLIVPAILPETMPPIAAENHPGRLTDRVCQSHDASNRFIRGPPSFLF